MDLLNPGTKPGSPALQADSLPTELSVQFSQCPGCFLTGGKPVKLSLEPNSSLSVNVGSVN